MNALPAVAFDFNGTLSRDEPIVSDVYRELFSARRDSAAWPSSALTGPSDFAQPTRSSRRSTSAWSRDLLR